MSRVASFDQVIHVTGNFEQASLWQPYFSDSSTVVCVQDTGRAAGTDQVRTSATAS